jgi:Na+-driven multidrug efflux pump
MLRRMMQNGTGIDGSGKLDVSDLTLNTVALAGFSLKSLWDAVLLSWQLDESAVIFGHLFPIIVLFNAISAAFANGTTKSLASFHWFEDKRLDLKSLFIALFVLFSAGIVAVLMIYCANDGLMALVGGQKYRNDTAEFIAYCLLWIPFQFCCLSLQNLARGFGLVKEISRMTIVIIGAGSALSPSLILGHGAWRGMGLNGVVISNALVSFCICAAILLLIFRKYRAYSGRDNWTLRTWKEIASVVSTSLASNILAIVFIFSFARIISTHGAEVMEGYAFLVRVEQVILVVLMSVTTVAVPLVAMAYRSGDYRGAAEIVDRAMWLLLRTGLALAFVFLVVVLFMTVQMQASSGGMAVMRNFAFFGLIGYPFQGGLIFFTGLLAIFVPITSFLLNAVRFLIVGLPMMWFGNRIGGVAGLFISIALLNIIFFFVAMRLFNRQFLSRHGVSIPIRD